MSSKNRRRDTTANSTSGRVLADLPTPAFVVNRHAFERNCQDVLDLAESRSLKIRPHIKTHKTLEGVRLQHTGSSKKKSQSVTGFVASTIPEVQLLVEYLCNETDIPSPMSILYGVPISAAKLPALNRLRTKLKQKQSKNKNTALSVGEPNGAKRPKLDWEEEAAAAAESQHQHKQQHDICVLVDHPYQVKMIEQFADHKDDEQWTVYVKIDTGYHR